MSSLQLGALGVSAGDLTESALRAVFTDLYFESNVTPRIHVPDPFGPVFESAVGRVVQPKVTLVSPQLGPKTIAPWGEPSPAAFPVAAAAGAVILAGLGYFAWKGLRC